MVKFNLYGILLSKLILEKIIEPNIAAYQQ